MPHPESPPRMAYIAVKIDASSAAPTQDEVSDILNKVLTAQKSQDSLDAAYALTTVLTNSVGFRGLKGYGVLDAVRKAASDKKNVGKREGAMFALGALFERFPPHQPLSEVVFLLQENLIAVVLDALSDKVSSVRESAQYAIDALFGNLKPEALVVGLLPALLKYLSKPTGKWQGTVCAYKLVGQMADNAKMGMGTKAEEEAKDVIREAMGKRLEGLIPIVEGGMHDLKSEACFPSTLYLNPAANTN
jgi:elongation factor 3